MPQKTARSFESSASGVIFTNDVVIFLDDTSQEIGRSVPHRTSYMAATRGPDGSVIEVDPATLSDDAKLNGLAAIIWDAETVAAHKDALASDPQGSRC